MTERSALFAPGSSVVVAVAHPDDETFGCGSLILLAVGAGATVTVLCATLGEAGERVSDPASDHLPLAAVREGELRAAAAVLGVHRIELMGHADSGFDGPFPDGAFCAVDVHELAAHLADRFDALAADVVVILDGSDGHRDHRYMRDAVELVASSSARPPRVVMSCLSNGIMRRWVEEMRAVQPGTAYMEIDPDVLGTDDTLLEAIDTSAQLERRERAIACHRSQRSPYEGLSAGLRRAFLATDHVIERSPT